MLCAGNDQYRQAGGGGHLQPVFCSAVLTVMFQEGDIGRHNLLSVGDATQSPADVMEYSAVSEVLDADYDAAGTCSEDLYVHAFNPVCPALHPKLRGHLQHSHHLCTATA